MNDASPPASAPAPDDPPARSSSDSEPGDNAAATTSGSGAAAVDAAPPTDTASTTSTASTWHDRLSAKQTAMLEEHFENLDWLVYVQLAALYYLDTSTPLLLLRLTTHLTPLPSTLTLLSPLPRRRAHANIYLPLLALLVSLFVHAFLALTLPGEASRFDNFGHILIDFVGQRAPAGIPGRLRLICMDIIVATLQGAMCGVAEALERGVGAGKAVAGAEMRAYGPRADDAALMRIFSSQRARQMLRGLRGGGGGARASADAGAQEEGGIEMQPLAGPSREADEAGEAAADGDSLRDDGDADGDALSSAETAARARLETLYAGQTMLVDVRVRDVMVRQYYEQRNRRLAGRV